MRLGLLIVLCVAGACGTWRRGAPVVEHKEIPNARVRAGQIAFYQACHTCHPGGEQGIGLALTRLWPNFVLRLQARSGFGEMPAFSPHELPAETLELIVEYIDWLQSLDVDIPDVR